jgi:carboxyl-terminal processing protease
MSFSLFSQNGKIPCEIISKINVLIQTEHVQPKPIDDSLSVYIFDNIIEELDPARNLILKSEYEELSQNYRLNIDDFLKNKNCDFITSFISTYEKVLLRNKNILEKINTQELNFNLKDTIRYYKKKYPFYLTEANIERVWQKKISFEILNDISIQSKNLDSLESNFKTLAFESKKIVLQNELCKTNTSLENAKRIYESFYSYFCSYFDPHTNYFSNDSKSSFVASLSKDHLSLGFLVTLDEKSKLIIEELNPNGPAFRSKKIKKGDEILSVSNEKETLKTTCASLESISNLIQSESNKSITLVLKRKTGKPFIVTLVKEVLNDAENTVYSFIINNKNKTGYLKIPSFYSDFESANKNGCAQDVAKEIIKLQKDNIKGLVIDLIDNGGGSMEEAIKIAGMFIKSGPISIVTDKSKNQNIIVDPDKGMLYKGPIVLLINGNSASASEFFAAILQDYNRALLIGSPTLGKATMQAIVPLDENNESNFVKLTINKFYRITGKSSQNTGVIPNVSIPSIYEPILQRESNYPTAFKNDTLSASLKFKTYVSNNLVNKLALNSKKRIHIDNYFNSIKAINKKINDYVNISKPAIPMTLRAVFQEQNEINNLWDEITTFDEKTINLNVINSEYNTSLLRIYPLEKETNQNKINLLKSNHYLNEAITIIEEFNALK